MKKEKAQSEETPLTAVEKQRGVSKQETAKLMSELLNSGDFFKLTPEEKHQFEMARLAEQAPIPNFIVGIAC